MLSIELIDQLARMNRMRIPEPIIHAKGAGARGFFIPYMSMRDYTKARFLNNAEIETPVFVRFSSMMGRSGSSDTERDVRGFSVRFLTEDGNYDLLGNHFPVFFIRDPKKCPSLIEALSPDPKTNIKDPQRLWKFVANNPETMQMMSWLYTNLGTIKSYRTMEGHSVHTYLWENDKAEKYFVRYHWKPTLGVATIDRQEAEFLAGFDPDVASRDLAQTFDDGGTVSFELSVQLIPIRQKTESESAILDPVCIWPDSLVPPIRVGKMILNRGVESYYEEVEKTDLSPANLIPGISLSQEPLLIAMTFLYVDDQRYRLGRDCASKPLPNENLQGIKSEIEPISISNANCDQLAHRLKSMSPKEREQLIENMAEELPFADYEVQKSIVSHLVRADSAMGASLEKWLAL